MTKSIREFTGRAGNIEIRKADDGNDRPYEVWFEDFCILGDGDSALEALHDAWRHTGDIMALISEATLSVAAGAGD
jgi:hypothetical protein